MLWKIKSLLWIDRQDDPERQIVYDDWKNHANEYYFHLPKWSSAPLTEVISQYLVQTFNATIIKKNILEDHLIIKFPKKINEEKVFAKIQNDLLNNPLLSSYDTSSIDLDPREIASEKAQQTINDLKKALWEKNFFTHWKATPFLQKDYKELLMQLRNFLNELEKMK